MQAMKPGYLAILMHNPEIGRCERLGANFFPPDQLRHHRQAFLAWNIQQGLANSPAVRHRLQFLEWTERVDCGIVELQAGFFRTGLKALSLSAGDWAIGKTENESAEVMRSQDVSSGEADVFLGGSARKLYLARKLREQIRISIALGEPLVLGQIHTDVISEVLNEFVFVPTSQETHPTQIDVVYPDGSKAHPFPLFCLHRLPYADQLHYAKKVRAALISDRFLENDPQIDFAWFRNREVAGTRISSQIDNFCFEATLQNLRDYHQLGTDSIDIYLTGLEPALIGFYRGIVEFMLNLERRKLPRSVAILPLYYQGKSVFRAGTVWK